MADETIDPQTLLAKSLFESKDPDVRAAMEEAIAKAHPQARIPSRELRLQAQAELEAIRKERQEFQKELADQRSKAMLEAERAKIREQHGLTDADLPHVEKIMTEELVGTHSAAAELYRQRNRAAQDVAAPRSIFSTMEVPGSRGNHPDYFKGLNGGPSIIADRDAWARQMADQIAQDFAANPAAAARKWG